jgi:GntR family transcriptional regulator
MIFKVDFTSGKAVYLQLVEQVRIASASGTLRAGDALPSIRPLAEELRVNRNTVAKAYAELEAQGVIETVAGKGCFVSAGATPLRKDARRKVLAEAVDVAVIQAHHLQLGRDEFLRLAEERYDALELRRLRAAASGRS